MRRESELVKVQPDEVTWTSKQHAACLWAATRFSRALATLDTMSFEDLYQAAAVNVLRCTNGKLGAAAFSGVKDAVRSEWGKDKVRLRMRPLVAELISPPEGGCGFDEEALLALADDPEALEALQREVDPSSAPEPKRGERRQRGCHFKREQWVRLMSTLEVRPVR